MHPAAGQGAQGTYNAGLTSLLADAACGETADNVALSTFAAEIAPAHLVAKLRT